MGPGNGGCCTTSLPPLTALVGVGWLLVPVHCGTYGCTMFVCGEVAVARCRRLIAATWEVLVPDAGRTAAFALAASPVNLTSNAEERTVVLTCVGAKMPWS